MKSNWEMARFPFALWIWAAVFVLCMFFRMIGYLSEIFQKLDNLFENSALEASTQ